jgi:hypothetical protein
MNKFHCLDIIRCKTQCDRCNVQAWYAIMDRLDSKNKNIKTSTMNKTTKNLSIREQLNIVENIGETLVAIRLLLKMKLLKSKVSPLEIEYVDMGIENASKLISFLKPDK